MLAAPPPLLQTRYMGRPTSNILDPPFSQNLDPPLEHTITDMPPGTDCPYPIRILAFFEMIRPYHVVIRI